jgi:alpha-maltose-1-phosphate synthase
MTPRVIFVNGGILGLRSFHDFITAMLPQQDRIRGESILLTSDLTLKDRLIRRALCQRLWPDGWLGLRNLDLARFRHEQHAGLIARRRIDARLDAGLDVLHFHRQATAYGSLDLMARVPSIVTMDCTQRLVIDAASTAIERATYGPNLRRDGQVFAAASAIIAISRWAADAVRASYPACATPVHVMPDPVMLHHFDPAWPDARRRRAEDGGVARLLFVGGDFPRKGGPALIEAWTAGGFAGRATLDVVTDWPVAGPLPEGVRVHRGVAAHSPAWVECWAAADAFVMPTTNEAFGLVYQEAAAASLPAIGTRHNAVPEIIDDEVTGLLVPPGDRDALVQAMRRLIASAVLREAMGRRARRKIESTADPQAYFDRLADLIVELAARGRRPG